MDLSLLVGFSILAFSTVIPPGPNFLLITSTVPASGRSVGMSTVAGLCTATCLHGVLAVLGLTLILAENETLFFTVKTIGAAYLFYLGLKALWVSLQMPQQSSRSSINLLGKSHTTGFREGLTTNALNPYTSVFYLSAFPQFMQTENLDTQMATLMVGIHMLTHLLWFGLLVVLIDRVVGAIQNQRVARLIHAVSGVCLMVIGLVFVMMRA